MKTARFPRRLVNWLLCLSLMLALSGCTETPVPPPGTPTTPGTPTSNTTSTTSGTPTSTTTSTRPPSSGVSFFGLGGESAPPATREDIQNNYGIAVVDGTGATTKTCVIAAGTWETAEISNINRLLSRLPRDFRAATRNLTKSNDIRPTDRELPKGSIIGGLYVYPPGTNYISDRPSDQTGVIVHEMTHAWHNKYPNVMADWERQFWNGSYTGPQRTSSVSDYGNANSHEDMSESVREYYSNGAHLRASDPERYSFIKTKIMQGVEF